MLLEILWALEALSAESAFVWLQWNMDADVRGNVVALDSGGTAVDPSTSQVQVVGRFASDMALTDVLIQCLGGLAALLALIPLACEVVVAADGLARSLSCGIDCCWSCCRRSWRGKADCWRLSFLIHLRRHSGRIQVLLGYGRR